jgi:inhibitor of cysteine peptidase
MLRIDERTKETVVEVGLGDTIQVWLKEDPTTGYGWELTASGEPILQVEEDAFLPAPAGQCGGEGTRQWLLRAQTAGTASLQMDYRRPWERKAVKTFGVIVNVEPL